MAQTLTVKLHLGTEIRRFKADKADLSWAALKKRVKTVFNICSSNELKVTYVDDEKDVITISTNDELQEAIGLALTCEPPVLRLTVASAATDEAVDAATETAPGGDADKPNNTKAPMPNPTAPGLPVPPELARFVDGLVEQLPAAMAMLPEELKKMIPHAELDLAATIAANTGADRMADRFCPPDPHAAGAKEGVHEGVTCDKSGVCPIVGPRYHLVGHNYDLCEAEFMKLSDKEKMLFRKVLPPGAAKAPTVADSSAGTSAASSVSTGNNRNTGSNNGNNNGNNNNDSKNNMHPGVECDRSGMNPIVGMRYSMRGHNYDLCQAEFDKLPASEKLLYDAIPPPALPSFGGPWRPGPGPWGHGPWGWRGGHGCGMGMGMGRAGKGGEPKLAARFVRDVTIFDGTQMAPGTNFTKIWRLKNVGEVPWPPGTRMLFVGGDQMTNEMSVPLSRTSAVMPGEEVDVAVEMSAPTEHGRYLGYWRLVGPRGRKFGQRVWCHVQVVDPAQSGAEAFDDLQGVLAEIERKKSDLAAGEAGENAEDDLDQDKPDEDKMDEDKPDEDKPGEDKASEGKASEDKTAAPVQEYAVKCEKEERETAAPPANNVSKVVGDEASAAEIIAASKVEAEAEASDGNSSDDGFVVTDGEPIETVAPMAKGKAKVEPGPSATVRDELLSMGFTDTTMIDTVLAKHGEDVEACARDLAAATEWDHLLDDLAEMGFTNRELNKSLMLKNGGNIKRTVRDLVEA